jgi:succinoglycan biosynthesis transport protein ExoP
MIDGNDERRQTSPALYLARRAARHYGLFLSVLAVALVGIAGVVRYTDQVYRSESVILYRNAGDNSSDSSRRVASRLQDMLMSHDRIVRVMNELRLSPDIKNRDEAADEVRKRIVFRARDGSTFLISFDAPSPALAQAVVSRLAATLIEDNSRLRRQEAEETGRFLAQEQLRLNQDVKEHEATLTAFLRAHPEALGRTEGGAAAEPAGMDELQREMERLRGTPSADGRPDPDVIANVRRAETDYDLAQKDFLDKEQRLTDVHPDLIAARVKAKQAAAALQRLREAAGLTRPATGDPGADQKEQVAAMEREMARLRRVRPGGVPRLTKQQLEVSVMFESLRHDLEQTRARLAGLQDKQFQAELATKLESNSELGQLAVLDPASRPGLPVVDVRKKVAIGGVIFALLLAFGAAAWRARRDDRIHDREDAEWLGGKPVLVLLPPPPASRRGRAAHG